MQSRNKSERSGSVSQTFATNFRGDISRRTGKIRAITLKGNISNADSIFGLTKAARESIEEIIGVTTAHDAWLETDRKVYELNDDALSIFGKTKETT